MDSHLCESVHKNLLTMHRKPKSSKVYYLEFNSGHAVQPKQAVFHVHVC